MLALTRQSLNCSHYSSLYNLKNQKSNFTFACYMDRVDIELSLAKMTGTYVADILDGDVIKLSESINCHVKEITLFTIKYAFNVIIPSEYMKTKDGSAMRSIPSYTLYFKLYPKDILQFTPFG